MTKLVAIACLCAVSAFGGDELTQPRRPGKKVWALSMVALAGATALDIQSSFGRTEANPLMSSPGPVFGWRNAGLKIGIDAPWIAFQFWRHRRHPEETPYRAYSVMNFAAAGAFATAATHNYGVKPAR